VELFTLDRGFRKQFEIDRFISAIWTERYYGDGEIELVVPATLEMVQKLPVGTFVGLVGSKEVMMIDTADSEKGQLKVTGSGLLPWLNNRFIRGSALHEDRYYTFTGYPAGQVMAIIVQWWCTNNIFLAWGSNNMGIPNPERFIVPGLDLGGFDMSGDPVTIAVPYGPVYDALRDIGTTYGIGMQITLEWAIDTSYSLLFRTYKGLDRTVAQALNPPVRFSPQLDTLTDIKELQSISNYKTIVYSFCPPNPDGLADTVAPGSSQISGPEPTGFDLRAEMTFEEDITTDMVGGDPATLQNLLNSRAQKALQNARFAKAVDGQIVPLHQLRYGVDYNMGDIIEVQGNSQVVSSSRVTEYIRSQDNSGEKTYPTVAMLS
jgi:hypothetical protein